MDFETILNGCLDKLNKTARGVAPDQTSLHYQRVSAAIIATLRQLRSEPFHFNQLTVEADEITQNPDPQRIDEFYFTSGGLFGDEEANLFRIRGIEEMWVKPSANSYPRRLKPKTPAFVERRIADGLTGDPFYFALSARDNNNSTARQGSNRVLLDKKITSSSTVVGMTYIHEYIPPDRSYDSASRTYVYRLPRLNPETGDFEMAEGNPLTWTAPIIQEGGEMVEAFTMWRLYQGDYNDRQQAENWAGIAESYRRTFVVEDSRMHSDDEVGDWIEEKWG